LHTTFLREAEREVVMNGRLTRVKEDRFADDGALELVDAPPDVADVAVEQRIGSRTTFDATATPAC
jgi:hypothetical protein